MLKLARGLYAAAVALACLLPGAAGAIWKPEYASAPQEVQDWYSSQKLTEPAQKRLGFKFCCDSSEVVKTRFRVDRFSGADAWYYELDGAWVRIPDDIIHWGEVAPGGKATLFGLAEQFARAFNLPIGTPTCFYPPEGGL